MHDLTSEDHWHEPTGMTSKAGLGTFKKPPMPYDVFMEEQEIPIVRAAIDSRGNVFTTEVFEGKRIQRWKVVSGAPER